MNIINNLSPDEALILNELNQGDFCIPLLIPMFSQEETGLNLLIGNKEFLTGLEDIIPNLLYPDNIVAYMANFKGLGLLKIEKNFVLANCIELYEDLENQYRSELKLFTEDKKPLTIKFKRAQGTITPFGRLFMNACLSSLREQGQED